MGQGVSTSAELHASGTLEFRGVAVELTAPSEGPPGTIGVSIDGA
jgi:hypothetical protein